MASGGGLALRGGELLAGLCGRRRGLGRRPRERLPCPLCRPCRPRSGHISWFFLSPSPSASSLRKPVSQVPPPSVSGKCKGGAAQGSGSPRRPFSPSPHRAWTEAMGGSGRGPGPHALHLRPPHSALARHRPGDLGPHSGAALVRTGVGEEGKSQPPCSSARLPQSTSAGPWAGLSWPCHRPHAPVSCPGHTRGGVVPEMEGRAVPPTHRGPSVIPCSVLRGRAPRPTVPHMSTSCQHHPFLLWCRLGEGCGGARLASLL